MLRPTRLGYKTIAFAILVSGAFFASPYSNLFFLSLAFMVVTAVVTPFCCLRQLRRMTAKVLPLAAVRAGSVAPFAVLVDIAGRPRQLIAVTVTASREQSTRSTQVGAAFLGADGLLTGELPPLPRGVYPLSAELTTTHPFGLLRAHQTLQSPGDLVVHPALADVGPRRDLQAVLGALSSSHLRCDDAQVAGLREHRSGEPVKGVHWKASARRNRLVVTEWDEPSAEGVEVRLDRRCSEKLFEHALSWLTTIAFACRDGGRTLTLKTQDCSATFGNGRDGWPVLLRWLAATTPLPPDGPPPPALAAHVLPLPESLPPPPPDAEALDRRGHGWRARLRGMARHLVGVES